MRAPKKKPFSESRVYSKHKVKNWSEYNKNLRLRGNIEFMIASNISDGWYKKRPLYRPRGRAEIYSDTAITICLKIRYLFNLKLRQTQGFMEYIFAKMGIKLACPDYTTLSRRSRELNLKHEKSVENIEYVAIDSTGIQTYTGNEWLENKHGKRSQRRTWNKLHICVDQDGMILGDVTTAHNVDDRYQIEELLKNTSPKELLADTGYDGKKTYESLELLGIKVTIRPPNKSSNECPKQGTEKDGEDSAGERVDKTTREATVEYIDENGYEAWRVKNNYGRREIVENTMFRFKTAFGSKFMSRNEKSRKVENRLKCLLLNRELQIARPISSLAA